MCGQVVPSLSLNSCPPAGPLNSHIGSTGPLLLITLRFFPAPPPLMVWKDPLYLLGPFSNSTGLFAALVAQLTTDPSHSHPKSQGLVMARRPP